jgi:hypothetical protein
MEINSGQGPARPPKRDEEQDRGGLRCPRFLRSSQHENAWVAERLASVEPKWIIDTDRARAELDARLSPRAAGRPQPFRAVWATAAATVAVAVIALVAVPGGRALAQDLWFRLFLNRVEVVRVDLSKLPLDTGITSNGMAMVVSGLAEAEQKAGFLPVLPPAEVLSDTPRIEVTGPISVRQTVRTGPLRAALAKAGASDVKVPDEWDGVSLRMEIGPLVIAEYPNEVQVLQSKPVELFVPSGFPLARFAEVAFRSTGLSWWESRALGEKMAANPAWLLDVPADEVVHLQEIGLRSGHKGLVVEDFDDHGAISRVTVIVATPQRIFAVSSGSRVRSLEIADSLR